MRHGSAGVPLSSGQALPARECRYVLSHSKFSADVSDAFTKTDMESRSEFAVTTLFIDDRNE